MNAELEEDEIVRLSANIVGERAYAAATAAYESSLTDGYEIYLAGYKAGFEMYSTGFKAGFKAGLESA